MFIEMPAEIVRAFRTSSSSSRPGSRSRGAGSSCRWYRSPNSRGRLSCRPRPSTPVFTIEGREVVLNPLEIVSVPVEVLKDRVDSLAGEGDRIIAALDELFFRAWR